MGQREQPQSGLRAGATKLVAQVAAAADAGIPPGETVSIAVRVTVPPGMTTVAAGVAGGVLGAAIAARVKSGARSADPAGFPNAPQLALGLTQRHLIACSRGGLTGRPKAFLAAIPLTAIAAVDHTPSRLGDQLTFTLRSGESRSFLCVKSDPAAAFATALNTPGGGSS
jgi:hypothetical protein